MKKFFIKHFFTACIISILLLTIFLRFYQYNDRFGLAYDQAHDALIAHYAVENYKLPSLGPFSSAGPFQTGGEWYWIIMFGTALFPSAVITPWIFMTSLYVVFVGLIMFVGYTLAGRYFALLVGILAAISPAQIAQGTNLTNQSPQALLALLAIYFAVLYIQKAQRKYLFFLGFCIGFAASIHLSGVGLMLLAVSLFIVLRRFDVKGIGLLLLGVFIPWIPVLLTDAQNHFTNTRNMIYYYLHDQHNIPLEALGRRWLTYAGLFWPREWAFIIGGVPIVGYLELALLATVILWRKVTKEIVVLILSIFGMIFLLRYTHTPIFSSYLVFTHPFVLLVTSWIVFILIKKIKIVGYLLLVVIVAGSLYKAYHEINAATNSSNIMARSQLQVLESKYKNQKFAVYTYRDFWKDKNYILALYLEKKNLLDRNGIKISTVGYRTDVQFTSPMIWGEKGGYQLLDIHASSSAILEQQQWTFVSGESVYEETENWFR